MKQTVLRTSLWLFSVLVLLNACTGVSVKESDSGNKEAYKIRAEKLAAISEWGFVGKISLDDGEQGGSGKLRWNVQGDHSEIGFHGVMGRGAWNMTIDPGRAVLRDANGLEQTAPDVNDIVENRIRWEIPVTALQWWVRGLAAPGAAEEEHFNAAGLLTRLRQSGWNVEYIRYNSRDTLALPTRLNATRENFRIKLAISKWHGGVNSDQAD